jgi:hypothetical protein
MVVAGGSRGGVGRGVQKNCLYTLQRKSNLCISSTGIAWPQSQFPHSCVCERFIYITRISLHIFLHQNRQTNRGNI